MAFEREVIRNIRHRVDTYDEQCLFENESSGPSTNAVISRSHVRLGSLDNMIHLSSYAKKLSRDIGLRDLRNLLAMFFRLNRVFNSDLEDGTISELKVGTTFICWQNVHTRSGNPLPRTTGHIRLPGNSGEEDGPPPRHDFLAWIWEEIRLCYSARCWTIGVSLLSGVRSVHGISSA